MKARDANDTEVIIITLNLTPKMGVAVISFFLLLTGEVVEAKCHWTLCENFWQILTSKSSKIWGWVLNLTPKMGVAVKLFLMFVQNC